MKRKENNQGFWGKHPKEDDFSPVIGPSPATTVTSIFLSNVMSLPRWKSFQFSA